MHHAIFRALCAYIALYGIMGGAHAQGVPDAVIARPWQSPSSAAVVPVVMSDMRSGAVQSISQKVPDEAADDPRLLTVSWRAGDVVMSGGGGLSVSLVIDVDGAEVARLLPSDTPQSWRTDAVPLRAPAGSVVTIRADVERLEDDIVVNLAGLQLVGVDDLGRGGGLAIRTVDGMPEPSAPPAAVMPPPVVVASPEPAAPVTAEAPAGDACADPDIPGAGDLLLLEADYDNVVVYCARLTEGRFAYYYGAADTMEQAEANAMSGCFETVGTLDPSEIVRPCEMITAATRNPETGMPDVVNLLESDVAAAAPSEPQQPGPSAPPAAASVATELPVGPGQMVEVGRRYLSPEGGMYLVLQEDGNLVVYAEDGRFLWGLNEQGVDYQRTARVEMRPDGRLVASDAAGATIWDPVESPVPGSVLYLDADGTLSVVSPEGTFVWASQGN